MIFSFITVIFGLIVFEIICSIDNAIINASVLKTMPEKYRKIFLFLSYREIKQANRAVNIE